MSNQYWHLWQYLRQAYDARQPCEIFMQPGNFPPAIMTVIKNPSAYNLGGIVGDDSDRYKVGAGWLQQHYPEVYVQLITTAIERYNLFHVDGIRMRLINSTIVKHANRGERKDNTKGGDLP